jgi:hypothetical protein
VNLEQLANILRAAATIVVDPNILVVGSQSVRRPGTEPNAAEGMRRRRRGERDE